MASHVKQHFNATTSRIDLRKYMTFKAVYFLKQIGSMKTFTKPNYNLCTERRLKSLKRYVTNATQLGTIIWRFMGTAGTKRLSIDFSSALMIKFLRGKGVRPLKGFSNLWTWTHQQSFLMLKIFLKSIQLWKSKLNQTLCWIWIHDTILGVAYSPHKGNET